MCMFVVESFSICQEKQEQGEGKWLYLLELRRRLIAGNSLVFRDLLEIA